ncbi:MAG TPA: hypothetical protein VID04_16645 [Methylomirabilota bacterium]|jgi:hypothetical protein
MKTFALLLLSVLLVVGLVGGALAQSSAPAPGSTTSNPETKPDNPTDSRNDPAPASPGPQRDQPRSTAPDVRSDRPSESPSTLPRSTESRGILGLSPTVVVLIGAALFIVVILALVSMTRNASTRSTTHIDYDRRP